jgi:hypothetical protein
VVEACSVAEYDGLEDEDASQPSKPNHTWKRSFKDWRYATVSGTLEDGCYVVVDGEVFVKLPGKDPAWFPSLQAVPI